MAITDYRDLLHPIWYKDNNGNKITIPRSNETYQIVKNKILLKEIPDELNKVFINGYYEIKYGQILSDNNYIVDYTTGEVTFKETQDAKTITVSSYNARGLIYIFSSRVISEFDESTNTVKETLGDIVINFKGVGVYSPSVQYHKKNIVTYAGGSYLCINDCIGIAPSNIYYWQQISSAGLGLVYKGVYDSGLTYSVGDFVQYSDSFYSCILQTTNHVPTNATYWITLPMPRITITTLKNSVTVGASPVSSVNTGITGYNHSTDDLFVIQNNTPIAEGRDYTVSGITITKTSGTWNAGTVFDFRVLKNAINDMTYADGSLIQDDSIPLEKLTEDVQEKINEIGILSDNIDKINTNFDTYAINIKTLGAVGDGNSHQLGNYYSTLSDAQVKYSFATSLTNEIDWAACQLAVNQGLLVNKNVYIPSGNYQFGSNTILIDRTSQSNRTSIVGDGSDNTFIYYSGNSSCISLKGNTSGVGDNYLSFQYVKGLTLSGLTSSGSKAINIDTLALFKAEDLQIGAFDYGIYIDGLEHSEFDRVSIRWCNQGIYATSTNFVTKTCPNNLLFTGCHIASNAVYGALFNYSTTVNFVGGSIENNGTNAGITGNTNNWGIKFKDAGFQGGVACNLVGIYIESNAGVADVWFENTAWETTDNSSVYSVIGCSFNKGTSSYYTINNIRCTFAIYSQVEYQKLSVINSSFKTFNSYSPSSARKNILFDGVSMNTVNVEQFGNIFANSTEAPSFPKLTKVGTLTRDISLSDGNISYTGIGFKPKSIEVFFTSSTCQGNGVSDETNSFCIYRYGTTNDTYSSLASIVVDGSNFIRIGLVSFDDDGFTLSYSKTGSPTGTATINYIAKY